MIWTGHMYMCSNIRSPLLDQHSKICFYPKKYSWNFFFTKAYYYELLFKYELKLLLIMNIFFCFVMKQSVINKSFLNQFNVEIWIRFVGKKELVWKKEILNEPSKTGVFIYKEPQCNVWFIICLINTMYLTACPFVTA